ncbi:amino acid carrier protein [Corallococcus sp. M34]|uniref:alanine/glycine:cation symporter family protein n=1 Tax=Citreicoccus inhibens TaxID=2849499 RepID=UPI001C231894|nr:amino acid carrier protein [Citreicoccus inhibens]MBU8895284.1 amino acid carrier protein [Citreicoccus inhibens]
MVLLPEPVRVAIDVASNAVWGPWTLALLLGTGVFLTVRLRFVQVVRFREALRAMRPAEGRGVGALSPFQAFMTALGASIGTGNIAGVATAIVSGGPGALFWIWVYGFFATAIKFTEAVLGIRYRVAEGGRLSAGPMHYLKDGLGAPRLAWVYALVAGVAALTTTPFTQPNSMAVVLQSQFAIAPWVSGAVIAVLTWLVVIGGVKSIGRAAERLAPLKVGLYLVGGLIVILAHVTRLPEVLALVVQEAFSMRAAGGGAAGVGMMVALRYGIARGIYANEAGYGTAAVAYGSARTEEPVRQGLQAVMEVFIVSCVTSTLSALVILVSGAWTSGLTSTAAVARGFETVIPTVGGWVVAFCAFLFGYTTLIGWAYYGEQFLSYALGPRVTKPYRWLYCGLIVMGAMGKVETIWAWGDLMNGLQVFPNLVGLVGLSGVAAATLRRPEVSTEPVRAAPPA